ncbi:MAG: UrcA family protein [Caulobacteraceae bacterium]|nr:MAG: UrcA family protein [Caulobacteraceae bacterium]
MSKIVTASLAALALLASAPAFAAEPPAKVLKTSDVNFRDPAAAQAFYAKLARTAAAVCDSNSANPEVTQQDRVCAKLALQDAVARLDQPAVTALHNATSARQFAAR